MQRNYLRKGCLWLSLLLVLGLCLTVAGAVEAGPKGGGLGRCMSLTPQQVGQIFDIKHQYMNDTAELRKSLAVKRAELAAIWRGPKPDIAQIKAKYKEINALKEQLQDKKISFRMQMRQFCPKKEDGSLAGPAPGMGMGRGHGPRGPCW